MTPNALFDQRLDLYFVLITNHVPVIVYIAPFTNQVWIWSMLLIKRNQVNDYKKLGLTHYVHRNNS